MFHVPIHSSATFAAGNPARLPGQADLAELLGHLSRCSARPRYAFMMLSLLAEVADVRGSAGPWVRQQEALVSLRDWLCDALAQMGDRDPKRRALHARVEAELRRAGTLPADEATAQRLVQDEVYLRVRASGKTNLSHTVSELVRAGLLRRHYQGYRVDHQNRGAQRLAVYTLSGAARLLLTRRSQPQLEAAGTSPIGDLFDRV